MEIASGFGEVPFFVNASGNNAHNDHINGGSNNKSMMSKNKRVTMIKNTVGKVKSSAYALPDTDFVYGIENKFDKEGAGKGETNLLCCYSPLVLVKYERKGSASVTQFSHTIPLNAFKLS